MGLSKLLDGGMRLREQERLISESGLFDAKWYVARYPEVGGASKALAHYLKIGSTKGYDPGPSFNAGAYLADNPDVRQVGVNPLVHFLRFGRFEGRKARDSEGRLSGIVDVDIGEEATKRLAEAFDADFYRATNPDLDTDADHFAHFMAIGWRERRDPAAWFSVEHYLMSHGDVAAADQNPFVHYVLWGCREGRGVQKSRRPRLTLPETPENGSISTVAVAMVKNEADILRCWMAHVLALFDELVIVDHGSEDGTAEFLQALSTGNNRIRFLRLEEPSYIQSVTMTHVVRNCPEVSAADWVFFLDADEFLPFADRNAFHLALEKYQGCPVITMSWINLVPKNYWDGVVEIDAQTNFLAPKAPSPFCKVAFQPGRVNLKKMVVAQGNHSLLDMLNGLELPKFDADFALLHVPVRSIDQLILKLNQGVIAYQKIGGTRDEGQGTHWYQMKEATAGADMSSELLNSVVVNYSEHKSGLVPVTHEKLLSESHDWAQFNLATCDLKVEAMPKRTLGEMLMRVHAQVLPEEKVQDLVSATRLTTTDDGRLRRATRDSGMEYAWLPKSDQKTLSPCVNEVLKTLLHPSYSSIEHLMPDDWGGHIPFMFSLARLIRPRRFVELGTLRGTSFFAFVQAVRDAGFESEAIAISGWAVEPARAAEFQNVFENFRFIARKFPEQVATLRMSFEQASRRFDQGSIDLLHLDGFCKFDDISLEFERWRSKLTDRGVVMVHDIAAHGADFGVWRFWNELKARFPTIEFGHAQGLGVACIGAQVPAGLRTLCEAVSEDADLGTLLQEHFGQLGQLMPELFTRRYDMEQADRRAGAEGALTEELTWLRQQLSTAEAEIADLRSHLNGELSHVANG